MRKFLILFLLLGVRAWGTTYYVSPSGSNTSPYDTWAKAATSPITSIGAISTAGDVVRIGGGTFTIGAALILSIDGTAQNPIKIIGSSGSIADGTGGTGPSGRTIFDLQSQTGNYGFLVTSDYNEISGIDFINFTGTKNAIWVDTTADGTAIHGNTFTDFYSIALKGTNTHFYGNWAYGSVSNPLNITGGPTLVYYNVFGRSPARTNGSQITFNTATTGNIFSNNTVSSFFGGYCFSNSLATTIMQNNLVFGCGFNGSQSVRLNSGTLTASNNFIAIPGNSNDTADRFSGSVTNDDSTNLFHYPKLAAYSKFGYLLFNIDDIANWELARSIASQMNSSGQYIGIAIETGKIKDLNHSDVVSFINSGNDILVHGWVHYNATTAVPYGLTITGRTGSTPTVVVSNTQSPSNDSSQWTGVLTLKESGSNVAQFSYSGTMSGQYDYLEDLCSGISAVSGWSCTQSSVPTMSRGKSVGLADLAGTSVESATHIYQDHDEFLQYDVADARTYMQSWIRSAASGRSASYSVEWFVPPYNALDNTVRDKVASSGYLACRSNKAGIADTGSKRLDQLLIYDIGFTPSTVLQSNCTGACDTPTELDLLRLKASSFAMNAETAGYGYVVYSHDEMTANEVAVFMQASASAPHANFKTGFNQFAEMLWNGIAPDGNAWTVGAGSKETPDNTLRLDHTFAMPVFNSHLLPSSPAINAGTDVGLTTDIEGKPIRGLPDIGAYEFQPVGMRNLLGVGR